MSRTVLLLLGLALLAPGLAAGQPVNLLAEARRVEAPGVEGVARLTDGAVPPEGDPWLSGRTARLRTAKAYVLYDLGASVPLRAAWLQGDNNDRYRIEASEDGRTWRLLWEAGPARGGGLRARRSDALTGTGRWIRISAADGDGAYTLSEVQLFSAAPAPEPKRVASSRPNHQRNLDGLIGWGLGLLAGLLLAAPGASRLRNGLAAALAVASGLPLALSLSGGPPPGQIEVAALRLFTAALVLAALLREWLPVFGRQAHPRAIQGALLLAGVLGALSFYSGGQPQFHDAQSGEKTFVHLLDLRQYHATARFYGALGYSGLYDADVAAFEELTGRTLPDGQAVRDLVTMRPTTVGARRAAIAAAPKAFSPEDWAAFKADVAVFIELMGEREWLRYLMDMGGNASPVWLANARILFDALPTSMASFQALAWLDPILLCLMFLALWRSFGPRLTLIALAVFGANDFIMYGSNWAGAVLRHDWLALLGLGAAALRVGRPGLGGALLGGAAMLRAFPALALFALLPLAGAWLWGLRRAGRWPSLEALRAEPVVRALLGAGIAAVALLLYSGLLLGFEAWPAWWIKVRQLTAAPHTNSLGLKAIMFSSMHAGEIAQASGRLLAFRLTQLGCALLLWAAIRGRPLERAALVGLLALPVVFYPSNYYLHLVCLYPLLAAAPRGAVEPAWGPQSLRQAVIAGLPVLVCLMQYPTTLIPDIAQHFLLASWLACGLALSLALLLVRDGAPPATRGPSPAEPG